MVNYLKLIESPTLYYSRNDLDTNEKIDTAIDQIHNYDDMKGIIGLVADNRANYGGATGHVDLLYEDFMWDISMYGAYGNDLGPYLKGCLSRENPVKFDMSIWILSYD